MTIAHHSFRFSANTASASVKSYPTRGLSQIHEVADSLYAKGFDVASPEAMAVSLRQYMAMGGELNELM
jgi:hypothetical protein